VYWGTTEHHPEPQWLLQAFDIEKKEHRVFAMRQDQGCAGCRMKQPQSRTTRTKNTSR